MFVSSSFAPAPIKQSFSGKDSASSKFQFPFGTISFNFPTCFQRWCFRQSLGKGQWFPLSPWRSSLVLGSVVGLVLALMAGLLTRSGGRNLQEEKSLATASLSLPPCRLSSALVPHVGSGTPQLCPSQLSA